MVGKLLSYWGPGVFSGAFAVSFREGNLGFFANQLELPVKPPNQHAVAKVDIYDVDFGAKLFARFAVRTFGFSG